MLGRREREDRVAVLHVAARVDDHEAVGPAKDHRVAVRASLFGDVARDEEHIRRDLTRRGGRCRGPFTRTGGATCREQRDRQQTQREKAVCSWSRR